MDKRWIIWMIVCCNVSLVHSQSDWYNKQDYSSITLLKETSNRREFQVLISAVCMFTSGAEDRNGLRWGIGLTLAQQYDNFRFSVGIDTYKAKQSFGIGTAFAGVEYAEKKYGASYYLNRYFQGDEQISAIIGAQIADFGLRFEDDIFALPFTGFVVHDRYRSAAIELSYHHFLLGTNIYTTEANGLIDSSPDNKRGRYRTGQQISSPIYVGYSKNNLLVRYGVNSALGGYIAQNWWHRHLFDSPDFNTQTSRNSFFQLGVDKPYTLY